MQKNLRRYGFIFILLSLTLVMGLNYIFRPFEEEIVEVIEDEEIFVKKVKTILTKEDILISLSPQERIAQLIAFPIVIEEDSVFIDEYIDSYERSSVAPGFITIFGSEIASRSAKIDIRDIKNIYEEENLPIKFMVDHEGGSVQRLNGEGYTKLPSWSEVCKLPSDDRNLLLRNSARELKETGIDIVLAPVLDVGGSRALSNRICSDSYPIVADRGVDFTTAFGAFGILPVLKHFPGIGTVNDDLHYDFESVAVNVNDVKLYKYVIEQSDIVAAMISHIGVDNQDSLVPCSVSKPCVGELKSAYPEMLIFSDALDMKSAAFDKNDLDSSKDLTQVTLEAVKAGNDVLIYGRGVSTKDLEKILYQLNIEYENDEEFRTSVDNAVIKVIEYKYL